MKKDLRRPKDLPMLSRSAEQARMNLRILRSSTRLVVAQAVARHVVKSVRIWGSKSLGHSCYSLILRRHPSIVSDSNA